MVCSFYGSLFAYYMDLPVSGLINELYSFYGACCALCATSLQWISPAYWVLPPQLLVVRSSMTERRGRFDRHHGDTRVRSQSEEATATEISVPLFTA